MISIIGDTLEGGGQIIRTSIALSAITGKPCKIEKIRRNRPNPGIQPQHLSVIKSIAKLCNTEVNAKVGDTSIIFKPNKIQGGHFDIDIGTAGAVSLVLQSLILPSMHAENHVSLRISGGTHVKWSPTMDYMEQIFTYYMNKIGIKLSLCTEKTSFYPKGGGVVSAKVEPGMPHALCLTDRDRLLGHEAVSVASDDLKKANVAERQIKAVENAFHLNKKSVRYVPSLSPGSSLHLSAIYDNCILGASALGERGKKAEKVGEEAALELKKSVDSGACFDVHMADQILPFLAFAKSNSEIKVADITGHVRTNIWVIEKFLPVKFEIDKKEKIIRVNVE